LALADRLLRRSPPLALLIPASLACAAVHVVWLVVPTPLAAVAGLFAVGLTSATHYPIVKAEAYASAPGRSGLVNAVLSALLPLEIATPIGLAATADHVSLRAALLALLAQPLGLLALALITRRFPADWTPSAARRAKSGGYRES